ncbi:MAG: class II aldolase/adducin family protein [Anaerolineaceae bacterium]|nr:class II aldolase/adducin family protein [Anaerolineaceae bacterium]
MSDLEYRQEIVETARELVKRGYLSSTGGNISIRFKGENKLAITPSDFDYNLMMPQDICIMSLETDAIETPHKPSVETSLHAAIYQVRPDVQAIIHTHQVFPSALALLNKPIPALFDEQVRFLGRSVKVIPYMPSGTPLLKNIVRKNVQDQNNAYMMANHGALIFGDTMLRAFHNVSVLEKCSIAYLLGILSGEKVSTIPLAIREIAFSKLRKDQKKAEAE